MNSSGKHVLGAARFHRLGAAVPLAALFLAGCGAAPDVAEQPNSSGTEQTQASTVPEDGLADAYETFISGFADFNDFDGQFRVSYGFQLGLVTEKVVGSDGTLARGQAILDMNRGTVTATLEGVPDTGSFDLWFVKNVAGGTVAPEATDQVLKVGTFQGSGASRTLSASLAGGIFFDLDLLVITRSGKKPYESLIAVGDRTLLEKRLFRFKQNKSLDPVSGTLADDVETTDPLVARGAELFFNETFGGNGRTCGTCHRAENNLTIDPAFIATLPQSDPLFVAENNPALAPLENPDLLRKRGLIVENVDGFDDPTHKFVMRGVPHTLSLSLTNGIANEFLGEPPDHRLGWSGDGAPGRGTLHEFAFGAIMQHFTKSLARRPGVDFRIPTEEELDALEAFQLFTGRQKTTDFSFFDGIVPTDPHASNGSSLFFNVGCNNCHTDLSGFPDFSNLNFNTGVANLTPELPTDDGFTVAGVGDGTFNLPPLAEAADTPPLFHNNSAATIEDAVAFYFSPTFNASPSGGGFFINQQLTPDQQGDVAAFLRVVNASANLTQVRKRAVYVQSVRSSGNTDLLTLAIADTEDARVVLADKNLNASVQKQIVKIEAQLQTAKSTPDKNRPAIMSKVIPMIDAASAALFTTTSQ
jgi:cytochrome c peroxidase